MLSRIKLYQHNPPMDQCLNLKAWATDTTSLTWKQFSLKWNVKQLRLMNLIYAQEMMPPGQMFPIFLTMLYILCCQSVLFQQRVWKSAVLTETMLIRPSLKQNSQKAERLKIIRKNALHSLISECTVSANGVKISNINGNYAHKAFIEKELSSLAGESSFGWWENHQPKELITSQRNSSLAGEKIFGWCVRAISLKTDRKKRRSWWPRRWR